MSNLLGLRTASFIKKKKKNIYICIYIYIYMKYLPPQSQFSSEEDNSITLLIAAAGGISHPKTQK